MKNKELEMNLLIGPGFKLDFVPIFHFPFPCARSPLPVLVTSQPGLVCKQHSSQLHSLCVGIPFSSTVLLLGIHLCKTPQLYNSKTRLGDEICSYDVNMHEGYCLFVSFHHPLSFGSLMTGAPNENIVQNHLNIALLNVF